MSSASPNPRALRRARQQRIDMCRFASARRSSAASGPNASDSMALSACSSVSGVADEACPSGRVGLRRRWSRTRRQAGRSSPHCSCSATMVSCAESSPRHCAAERRRRFARWHAGRRQCGAAARGRRRGRGSRRRGSSAGPGHRDVEASLVEVGSTNHARCRS